MKSIRFISLIMAMLLVLSGVATTRGQEKYPAKPIHLIVPMAAGGGTDRVARALAEALKNYLPQPVLVENLPGAGSVVGMSRSRYEDMLRNLGQTAGSANGSQPVRSETSSTSGAAGSRR